MEDYIVYCRTDDNGRIVAVNSSEYITDYDGWTEIDRGVGVRYHHAQGNYFPKPIMDDRGIYRYKAYKFVDAPDGKIIARFFKDDVEYFIVERANDEMDSDYTEPEMKQSTEERVAHLEAQNEALLECLLEMSEIVYA